MLRNIYIIYSTHTIEGAFGSCDSTMPMGLMYSTKALLHCSGSSDGVLVNMNHSIITQVILNQ